VLWLRLLSILSRVTSLGVALNAGEELKASLKKEISIPPLGFNDLTWIIRLFNEMVQYVMIV
jgi:hypothetical protein